MAYPYPQYYPQPYPQGQLPQMQQQPQNGSGMLVRPVASMEEARSMPTDFSGQMTIMPDISHGFVYTKQVNPHTFAADFAAYRRVEIPTQETAQAMPDLSGYVKKEDFDDLAKRFNALLDQLGGGGNANAQ